MNFTKNKMTDWDNPNAQPLKQSNFKNGQPNAGNKTNQNFTSSQKKSFPQKAPSFEFKAQTNKASPSPSKTSEAPKADAFPKTPPSKQSTFSKF